MLTPRVYSPNRNVQHTGTFLPEPLTPGLLEIHCNDDGYASVFRETGAFMLTAHQGQDAKPTEITSQNTILALAFSADGNHVVAGGEERMLKRWRIDGGLQVGPAMNPSRRVFTVAVSRDGRWIVSGDDGNRAVVWNATTHEKVVEVTEHAGPVMSVDISSDSTKFASGSNDNMLRIFSIPSGLRLIPPVRHDSNVVAVAFSPGGDRLATATFSRASVRVLDAHTGNKLFDIPVLVNSWSFTPFAWSPDGQYLFAASPGIITRLDISTSSRSEWSIPNHDPHVNLISNGRFIACSSGSSLWFWDSVSHTQINSGVVHAEKIQRISLSPDERYLACGYGSKVAVHALSEILPQAYINNCTPSSQFPLMEVSDTTLESWFQADPTNTDTVLSEEITRSSDPSHNAFANRSLVRAHLQQWDAAVADAKKSLQIKLSSIGHIAMAYSLICKGEEELALQAFDFAFRDCGSNENSFLLLVKAVLLFISGKHEDAISRVVGLIATADDETRPYYVQVLGSMYVKQGDYEHAMQLFQGASRPEGGNKYPHLVTISMIFGWTFDGLELMAWQGLCESLYASGRTQQIAGKLLMMIGSLEEGEKEAAHGRILEEVVTKSGEMTLLAWTGASSACNSCLPASPSVYNQPLYTPPSLEESEMEVRTEKLRSMFTPLDAMVIYDRVTRLQPVRFAHFRLHLPCIVFRVKSLRKDTDNVYSAEVTGIGHVEFTTADSLPLKEPGRLVFANPWIRDLHDPYGDVTSETEAETGQDSNTDSNSSRVDVEAELVYASLIEEVPATPSDAYTRALQLIARLGQPFNALLFLKQSDGAYKRVAAGNVIVVPGLGCNIPRDIRTEVLEIL